MTESIIEAKQDRSIATQNRLIAALHNNLKTKYFEHISIKELASEANVSVGTFYRRFGIVEQVNALDQRGKIHGQVATAAGGIQ